MFFRPSGAWWDVTPIHHPRLTPWATIFRPRCGLRLAAGIPGLGWLHEAHQQHGIGALTFNWYNVGPKLPEGHIRKLIPEGQFTTTIDQVALAFTAPANLPPAGVYQDAIQSELEKLRNVND